MVVFSKSFLVAAALLLLLSTVNADTSECLVDGVLQDDTFIENGVCVMNASSSVWYYGIRAAPVSGNGLLQGAPTDINLLFGAIGHSVEMAWDPFNFGLQFAGAMHIQLSEEFIYDQSAAVTPIPNVNVGLGTAMGNAVHGYSNGCNSTDIDNPITCGLWTAEFGDSPRTIVIKSPNGGTAPLAGSRVETIGLKLSHIRPAVADNSAMYYNANGTCVDTTMPEGSSPVEYCRVDADCPNATCTPLADSITGSILVTVKDTSGKILYMGKRSVPFHPQPRHSIYAVNFLPPLNKEANESINFQHVSPGSWCGNTDPPADGLFSSDVCYAARFMIFGPGMVSQAHTAYPHAGVDDLEFNLGAPKSADDMPNEGGIYQEGTLALSDGTVIGTVQLGSAKLPMKNSLMMVYNSMNGDGGDDHGGDDHGGDDMDMDDMMMDPEGYHYMPQPAPQTNFAANLGATQEVAADQAATGSIATCTSGPPPIGGTVCTLPIQTQGPGIYTLTMSVNDANGNVLDTAVSYIIVDWPVPSSLDDNGVVGDSDSDTGDGEGDEDPFSTQNSSPTAGASFVLGTRNIAFRLMSLACLFFLSTLAP